MEFFDLTVETKCQHLFCVVLLQLSMQYEIINIHKLKLVRKTIRVRNTYFHQSLGLQIPIFNMTTRTYFNMVKPCNILEILCQVVKIILRILMTYQHCTRAPADHEWSRANLQPANSRHVRSEADTIPCWSSRRFGKR